MSVQPFFSVPSSHCNKRVFIIFPILVILDHSFVFFAIILPSKIFLIKLLSLKMCPQVAVFLLFMVVIRLPLVSIFLTTSSFLFFLVQLVFVILLQNHISAASKRQSSFRRFQLSQPYGNVPQINVLILLTMFEDLTTNSCLRFAVSHTKGKSVPYTSTCSFALKRGRWRLSYEVGIRVGTTEGRVIYRYPTRLYRPLHCRSKIIITLLSENNIGVSGEYCIRIVCNILNRTQTGRIKH